MYRSAVALLFSAVLALSGCARSQSGAKPVTASAQGLKAELETRTTAGTSAPQQRSPLDGTLLAGAQRILFLGDSITYSGQYIDDLQMVLRNFPKGADMQLLDLGLPSETVSGLTEPGHANGAFPRPNLHDRLPRLLELTRPDLVIACYGMNDGIYYPFDPAKFDKFQSGIRLLRDRVLKAKARLILVTPPVFDPSPIRSRTLPAGLAEYRQPYEGYNEVLDRYSDWLLGQRSNGWQIIDVHFPMNEYLKQRRRENAGFMLASDGVHLDDTGHWLMAQVLLSGLKVPVYDSSATIDLKTGTSGGRGETKDFHRQESELDFVWVTRPPMPLIGFSIESVFHGMRTSIPAQGQAHLLIALHGDSATYRVFAEDQLLTTLSRAELERGLDTRQFDRLITTDRGRTILQLIHSRTRILSDAWLTHVGHSRPGMVKGLPIEEAETRATSLRRQIDDLSRPIELHFRLVALPK